MIKIVGFRDYKGEFVPEGKTEKVAFHNYDFSFITDENNAYNGLATIWNGYKAISVSAAKLKTICGVENPADLVGKEIRPYYVPRYGRVVLERIEIVK